MAETLKLKLNDVVSFDINGSKIDLTISNLRNVDWDTFNVNFFTVLPPGVLEEMPANWVTSVYLNTEQRQQLGKLVRQFSNITLIDIETIMQRVRGIIARVSLAVEFIFLFTLLAGFVVMLAAIQVTRDERRFESAILHTLGANRRKILQGVAVEFSALGGLAGVLAAIGATGIGYQLAERVFDLEYPIDPNLWLVGLLPGAAVVGVTGTLATRRAVNEPPVAVLRET